MILMVVVIEEAAVVAVVVIVMNTNSISSNTNSNRQREKLRVDSMEFARNNDHRVTIHLPTALKQNRIRVKTDP